MFVVVEESLLRTVLSSLISLNVEPVCTCEPNTLQILDKADELQALSLLLFLRASLRKRRQRSGRRRREKMSCEQAEAGRSPVLVTYQLFEQTGTTEHLTQGDQQEEMGAELDSGRPGRRRGDRGSSSWACLILAVAVTCWCTEPAAGQPRFGAVLFLPGLTFTLSCTVSLHSLVPGSLSRSSHLRPLGTLSDK